MKKITELAEKIDALAGEKIGKILQFYTRMSLNFGKRAKPDFPKFITPASLYPNATFIKKSEIFFQWGIVEVKDKINLY